MQFTQKNTWALLKSTLLMCYFKWSICSTRKWSWADLLLYCLNETLKIGMVRNFSEEWSNIHDDWGWIEILEWPFDQGWAVIENNLIVTPLPTHTHITQNCNCIFQNFFQGPFPMHFSTVHLYQAKNISDAPWIIGPDRYRAKFDPHWTVPQIQ